MRLIPSRPRPETPDQTPTAVEPREHTTATSLPGNQLAAGAARRFVRSALADWTSQGLPEPAGFADRVVDDGLLLASELVTNAVVHAGTTVDVLCRLDLARQPAGLVIEVSDQHPSRVLRGDDRQSCDSREGGRGLQLVAALSDSWGITYRRDRKTVWCRLDLTGPDDGERPAPLSAAETERALHRDLRAAEILAPAP
ncbi:MAG TPA: ATP-binding protein, partial [Streptomyces sp.]